MSQTYVVEFASGVTLAVLGVLLTRILYVTFRKQVQPQWLSNEVVTQLAIIGDMAAMLVGLALMADAAAVAWPLMMAGAAAGQ